MESKLKEYRALRRRQELIENTKEKIEQTKQKVVNFLTPTFLTNMHKEKREEEVLLLENDELSAGNLETYEIDDPNEVASEVSEVESFEEPEEPWRRCIIRWSMYFVLWLTFYLVFLKLQFGAVYFILTVLIGVFLNTRTRPRKKGEISAYSVFNKNCKSIEGTLKAEDLEKQMLYGIGSVKMF